MVASVRCRELRAGVEQGDRGLDLGRPDEADRPLGPGQRAAADQLAQRPRHLQHARAARGIVVRARIGMIEMAGIDDLLIAAAAGDDRGRDQIGARLPPRIDVRAQPDRLARPQPRLPGAGAGGGDHEGEAGMRREGVEMPPAQQGLVVAIPAGTLVLRPGDDPRRAVTADGEILHDLGLGGGEDEPAAYFPALIVRLGRPRTDIDQLRLGAAGDAVLREAERLIRPGGDPFSAFPELGRPHVPAGARALRAVEDRAVRGQRDDLDAVETVALQPVADRFGGGAKPGGAAHAVVGGEDANGLHGARAGDFGGDGGALGGREERRGGGWGSDRGRNRRRSRLGRRAAGQDQGK